MRLEYLLSDIAGSVEKIERYTHRPNVNLMDNLSKSQGSTEIRKAKMKDGCSFIEPVAGQGFNDQFPWR